MPSASSTLNLRDGLRAAGIDSDVFYGNSTPDVERTRDGPSSSSDAPGATGGCCIKHRSGARSTTSWPREAEPKLVNYHNITPAALLRDWEPAVAYEAALGRTQLARLAPQSRFAVADSAFNESELQALGYEETAVVPLLIDMHVKSDEPDPELAAALARRKEREGGCRPALRGEDLAPQGPARPGQDARRPAPRRRPGGPPAPRRIAAR